MSSSFDEALHDFKQAVLAEYGPAAAIVRIAINPYLYDKVNNEMFLKNRYALATFTSAAQVSHMRILDIDILPRINEPII